MFRKVRRYMFYMTHPILGEVWQLHRVRPNLSTHEDNKTYEVTPLRLENLIVEYLKKGYHFISIDDVAKVVSGDEKQNKFVSITLDDGYEDNLLYAYPIFKKYNVPFCIYITKSYVDKGSCTINDERFRILSLQQIIQLHSDPLCSIGVHTVNHPHLNKLSCEEQKSEILECKIWLESILSTKISTFAFPFGDYNIETVSLLRNISIENALAAWGGGVRKTGNLYEIPRLLVTENTIK